MTPSLRRLLVVPAELEAHGRQQLVLEVRLAARREPLVEGGREDLGRDPLVDGRQDGPAPLAGVGDPPREPREVRRLEQRDRRQVEQPRGDDAAAPPDLGDVGEVQVVLVVLGVAERRRLGVHLAALRLADVGVLQDVEPLGVGRHQPVLDAVVDHLDEVAGTVRPAVEIALFGGAADLLAPGRPRERRPGPGRAA